MTGGKRRVLLAILLFLLEQPISVMAQEIVTKESLDDWFYSRLIWGALAGVILGLLIGLLHLCRLSFEHKGALNINSRARRKLLIWAGAIVLVVAILLLCDAWLLYPFRSTSLSFSEALTQVWANYRTVLILITTLSMFLLFVAVATRLKSDCRCRYAFIPGPRGK